MALFLFSFFFWAVLKWVLSCGAREGIEGAGQRLAKSDERAVGADSTESERGDVGEGKGKKESKPVCVEEVGERVTVYYKRKKKDSERAKEGERVIKKDKGGVVVHVT